MGWGLAFPSHQVSKHSMGAASVYVERKRQPQFRPSLLLLTCRRGGGGLSPVGKAEERQPLGFSLKSGASRTMSDGESCTFGASTQ